MASLFDLVDDSVELKAESLTIPPFDKIWKRDKTKKKEKAYNEICYIYHLCDFNSPYSSYTDEERREQVAKDFKVKPDKLIEEAVSKYKELQETYSMRLLARARGAIDKMGDYFDAVDFKELDDNGKPVYTAKDLAANLEKLGKIIESMDKITEKVQKEITTQSRLKGGRTVGPYER